MAEVIHEVRADDGARLAVLEIDDRVLGPPVLMFGGGIGTGAYASWLTELEGVSGAKWFSANGFSVFVADPRGYGLSEPVPDREIGLDPVRCSFADYSRWSRDAEAVLELLYRKTSRRVDVIGHCNGAGILFNVRQSHQEIMHSMQVLSPSYPVLRGRFLGYRLPVENPPVGTFPLENTVARIRAASWRRDGSNATYELMRDDIMREFAKRNVPSYHSEIDATVIPARAFDETRLSALSLTPLYHPDTFKGHLSVIWCGQDKEYPYQSAVALASRAHNSRSVTLDVAERSSHCATFDKGRFALYKKMSEQIIKHRFVNE